jgi:outer membrane protein assembly factor BamB
MANVYSQLATNDVATPRVANNPAAAGGRLREASARAVVAADQASGDVVWFHRVPTNCRISELLFTAADATTAGALHLGVYRTPENGGAVVDADFFASALALTSGPYAESDQKNESTTYTLEKQQQPLWQALGESADPGGEYYICATYSTTGNGGPTELGLKTRFAV